MTHQPADAIWLNKVGGLLLGGALGDALGAPFEGSPEVDPRRLDRLLASEAMLRWTDDTALQLAFAEHLAHQAAEPVTGAEVDEDRLAVAFARTWQAEPWRGYGANPPRIFEAVLAGSDWRTEARRSFGGRGSLGNGGAMRAAPAGALPGGLTRVGAAARRSAAITHAHPVGQDGAAIVAVAVHVGIHQALPGDVAPKLVLQHCGRAATTAELRDAVGAAGAVPEDADPAEVARQTGNGIAAHEAVGAALGAALRHPDDPLAAILFAVRMGGDTDTVAAIAGSIVGAWTGASAIPEGLLTRIEQRTRIQTVAARLAGSTRAS
ncbi:ADP-ribosylglycohydrolase family protein [Blastococcus sp. SYSU DS0541]